MITIIADRSRTDHPHWPVPAERRTVTVLFVDIVGSTALVDRLDPEDVRALQRAYFDTVAGVLHRWQGVVEKYVGDAVMALFGARNSDGFDAYRAVRAGLEIQAALDRHSTVGDIRLRVRVGVATGEVVVDLGDAVSGGHGVASGAVITTAARLQEYAPPGAVALCATTARATAGLIAQRQLASVPVTGRVSPMPVWHAVGPIRPSAARHDGPLIGRRRELATISEQLIRALRERSPRWVSVVGPAGSGRSRLLHELTRALPTVDGVSVRWSVVGCPPYPDQVLAPIAELARNLAGIRHGDGPATVRKRLTDTLTPLFAPDRVAAAVPALQRLLAAPDSGADALNGAAICRDVLLRLAADGPLVVAVDDVDRAAPVVSRFLHALFSTATARGLPLAVLTVHQPQWADTRPGPARRVTIRPLATVQSGRLLRHLLARAGQPVALVDRLLPLVGGRPGHATAYVAAVTTGTDPTVGGLPEAVHRAASAELDRFGGEHRAVLMAAGTLDGGISGAAIDRALDWAPGRSAAALRDLVAAGLLLPRRAGGYAFTAPALRQVAAERLPRALRAVFARRAADAPRPHSVLPVARQTDSRAVDVHPTTVSAGTVHAGTVHAGTVHAGTVSAGAVSAGAVSGSPARHAEVVRLNTALADPAPQPRRMPVSTGTSSAASSRDISSPLSVRRLRAVATAGATPPARTMPASHTDTLTELRQRADRLPAANRAAPAVPTSAGRLTSAGVGAPPGTTHGVPAVVPVHPLEGLAASA
ncbi:adenylate/guanylate cyclase domain-containing protein [Micromonospora profundi]|uniref:AAA family ATPase n=1 Tax=Micromonospora profundi TaxID=1420889 RepID=UPI0033A81746